MRLISQDGMIDVPYENLTIAVDNDNDGGKVHILARGIVEYLSIIIAVYSNTDKALKVMEILRDCYLGKDCGYRTEHNICYPLRNDFETKVFKFPADEEVEV